MALISSCTRPRFPFSPGSHRLCCRHPWQRAASPGQEQTRRAGVGAARPPRRSQPLPSATRAVGGKAEEEGLRVGSVTPSGAGSFIHPALQLRFEIPALRAAGATPAASGAVVPGPHWVRTGLAGGGWRVLSGRAATPPGPSRMASAATILLLHWGRGRTASRSQLSPPRLQAPRCLPGPAPRHPSGVLS